MSIPVQILFFVLIAAVITALLTFIGYIVICLIEYIKRNKEHKEELKRKQKGKNKNDSSCS